MAACDPGRYAPRWLFSPHRKTAHDLYGRRPVRSHNSPIAHGNFSTFCRALAVCLSCRQAPPRLHRRAGSGLGRNPGNIHCPAHRVVPGGWTSSSLNCKKSQYVETMEEDPGPNHNPIHSMCDGNTRSGFAALPTMGCQFGCRRYMHARWSRPQLHPQERRTMERRRRRKLDLQVGSSENPERLRLCGE